MIPAAVLAGAALTVFALLPHGVALLPALAVAAVAGAAFPPVGACLRTLWPAMLGDDPGRIHAAFSLEAAAVEATYIAGPVLIAGAIGAQSTFAALLTCVALLLGGVGAFCAHPASRAWRPAPTAGGGGLAGPLRAPGVRTLMLVFLLLGATFGSVEVAVPVAAEAAGHAGTAGLLLGVWGFGSLLGGLAAARAGAAGDPVRRLTVLLARAGRRTPAAGDPHRAARARRPAPARGPRPLPGDGRRVRDGRGARARRGPSPRPTRG